MKHFVVSLLILVETIFNCNCNFQIRCSLIVFGVHTKIRMIIWKKGGQFGNKITNDGIGRSPTFIYIYICLVLQSICFRSYRNGMNAQMVAKCRSQPFVRITLSHVVLNLVFRINFARLSFSLFPSILIL